MSAQVFSRSVVTGSAGVIGTALARELAGRGSALVLVGRNPDRLESLAAELRCDRRVQVEVLAADLTSAAGLARVEERLQARTSPVDLLVNNAGVLGRIGNLTDLAAADETFKLLLNVVAPVRLSNAVLPGMIERGHGGILNVASIMSFLPTPGGASYSASKAFLLSLSESLHGETRAHGVNVTAVCPGSLNSALHSGDQARASLQSGRGAFGLGLLDPTTLARQAVDAVATGRPVCVPGLGYQWLAALSRLLPRHVVRAMLYRRWSR